MPITKIHARQIFDSRGNPTVEVDVTTNKGKHLVLDQCQKYRGGEVEGDSPS